MTNQLKTRLNAPNCVEEKALLRRISLALATSALFLPTPATAQTPAQTLPADSSVSRILPGNTAAVVMLNLKPELWQDLNRFNPYQAQLQIIPFNSFPLTWLSPQMTLSDVQGWLGEEVAIALLPPSQPLETIGRSTLFLSPIKDQAALDAFLTKLKTSREAPTVDTTYKGIPIVVWEGQATPANPATPIEPTPIPEETPSPDETSEPPSQVQQPTSPTAQWLPTRVQVAQQHLVAVKDSAPSANPLPPTLPPGQPLPGELLTAQRGLAIARLPGHVVIAGEQAALERFIDSIESDSPRLASTTDFQRTVNHPQYTKSLVTAYGSTAELLQLVNRIDPATVPPTAGFKPPLFTEKQIAAVTKDYRSFNSFTWVEPNGLRSQSNTFYTAPKPEWVSKAGPDANQILNRLPAATFLSANSRNFNEQWQSFLDSTKEDEEFQADLAKFRSGFQSTLGIDFEKELVSWLDGEYVFFFFPAKNGLFSSFYPGLDLGMGLMVQTSDRAAAEASLAKLDAYIRKQPGGPNRIVQRQVQGSSFTSWEDRLDGKVVSGLAYGWVDEKTLLITSGTGVLPQLVPQPYIFLPPTYTFQTAIKGLPTPNEGYLFVNMGASLSFLYGLVLPSVPSQDDFIVREVQRILGTLRSVSTTNSATLEAQSFDVFWVLSEQPSSAGSDLPGMMP
uniref:DUF3352 domain-containing protein n=1 Tax=Oscillatoriales cyanobacterium SpSt-418 TaxID=2282169 RepID=A0A7C3KFA0_9CYAN